MRPRQVAGLRDNALDPAWSRSTGSRQRKATRAADTPAHGDMERRSDQRG